MSLEELEEYHRMQRRARPGTLVITGLALALTAYGISLIPGDGPSTPQGETTAEPPAMDASP